MKKVHKWARPTTRGRVQSTNVKSNEESLMQYLNVLYQWRWSVVPKSIDFVDIVFEKVKIGMDKTYQKQLLSNIEIIKRDF